MKKILIATLFVFGMFVGPASAVSVPLASFDILTIGDGITPNAGGFETDGRSYTATTAAGGADLSITRWVGLDVIVAGVSSIMTAEDQTDPGGVTTRLNIEVFNAFDNLDNTWEIGSFIDSSFPSPLEIGLAMNKYLVRITGDLPAGVEALTHNFGLRVTSVVPVPAAAWLFGSAILGLIGLRRKSKLAPAA